MVTMTETLLRNLIRKIFRGKSLQSHDSPSRPHFPEKENDLERKSTSENLDLNSNVIPTQNEKTKPESTLSQISIPSFVPVPDLDVNKKDKAGNTLLHLAVDKKDEALIRQLIQNGANVNAYNKKHETPLYRAAKGPNNDICIRISKYLIDNGADVYATDYMNKTFLHVLLREDPPLTPEQFHSIAEYLVGKQHSEIFNLPSFLSITPFQFAVYRLEVKDETLSLLVKHGANVNMADELGRSGLFWAVNGWRTPAFLSKLIEYGADSKNRNNIKRSLLHQASNWDNLEALKFFLEKGLDVNAVDIEGDTPLHYVMRRGKGNAFEMSRLLIENGAVVKARNNTGDTPLSFLYDNAVMLEKEKVVELLRGHEK